MVNNKENELKPFKEVQIGDLVAVPRRYSWGSTPAHTFVKVDRLTATQAVTANNLRLNRSSGKVIGWDFLYAFVPTPEYVEEQQNIQKDIDERVFVRGFIRGVLNKKEDVPTGALQAMRTAYEEWIAQNKKEDGE